jgi:hypothetical protein
MELWWLLEKGDHGGERGWIAASAPVDWQLPDCVMGKTTESVR